MYSKGTVHAGSKYMYLGKIYDIESYLLNIESNIRRWKREHAPSRGCSNLIDNFM